eukprot:CAMPEP_0115519978 /NCGR_PEP_ID=MMETSP0271-20121206/78730_1 /TAXON_ID=71861 /ORGANISM="Scrippsiella trochoidea, Strain CCMP3099" /LENGTH=155 /DNA_ID=CAMNT_0002951037 /DNA_START=44 /DNA_END=511 /DNA_ORIENTATION=-
MALMAAPPSRCPMFDLILPIMRGSLRDCFTCTLRTAPTSIGSPSEVPVPWHSQTVDSGGCIFASRIAPQMHCSCREAGTPTILVGVRAAEQSVRVFLNTAISHDKRIRSVAPLVSICSGVEGEATASCRKHVRLGTTDKATDVNEQLGANCQAEL